MCLFFLASEVTHPVFMYVCHRSVSKLTIRQLCFLIEVERVLFLEKSHYLRNVPFLVSRVTHGDT